MRTILRGGTRKVRSDSDSGFSLIEMMIATLVLSVIGAAGLSMTAGSLLHVAGARQEEGAVALVEKQLEQVRALPPANLTTYTPVSSTVTQTGTTYTITTTMSTAANGTFEWVQVKATWPNNAVHGITGQVVDQELLCASTTC